MSKDDAGARKMSKDDAGARMELLDKKNVLLTEIGSVADVVSALPPPPDVEYRACVFRHRQLRKQLRLLDNIVLPDPDLPLPGIETLDADERKKAIVEEYFAVEEYLAKTDLTALVFRALSLYHSDLLARVLLYESEALSGEKKLGGNAGTYAVAPQQNVPRTEVNALIDVDANDGNIQNAHPLAGNIQNAQPEDSDGSGGSSENSNDAAEHSVGGSMDSTAHS